MITEDYVSFEVAKLLKEKGFIGDGEVGCRCGFYKQNKEYPSQIDLVYDDLNNFELEYNECLRFTHQMIMKWLREVYNICIVISCDVCDSFDFYATIYIKGESSWIHVDYIYVSKDYKQVADSAIEYCLTNLI